MRPWKSGKANLTKLNSEKGPAPTPNEDSQISWSLRSLNDSSFRIVEVECLSMN